MPLYSVSTSVTQKFKNIYTKAFYEMLKPDINKIALVHVSKSYLEKRK